MFIDGFGIAEYRSFGPDLQRIGPLKKINLFIGQNNCGKSNVLLFLKHHYSVALQCKKLNFAEVDRHIGSSPEKQIVEFGLQFEGDNYNALIKRFGGRLRADAIDLIRIVLQSKTLSQGDEIAWFRYEGTEKKILSTKTAEDIYAEKIFKDQQWYDIYNLLTNKEGGDLREHWIPQTLQMLSPVNLVPPKVDLVPAFREIKGGSVSDWDLRGVGMIEKLFRLQNPVLENLKDREKFQAMNRFLQTVIGNPKANLQVPHNMGYILVDMDGKTLPLDSLGTGIHEVIIMAATATVLQNQVLCIEEPEIHLHPLLQKQLLRYLNEKTSNQYFISTHSAHILDTTDAAVFHVTLENGESRVELALSGTDKSRICDDLGYKASDLLQANCVIWVEGPSDRIYLNHWIHSKAPELVEGLHYSIMFYGGRLLSHLSADDPVINEFISLRQLNRHISIVIDSDRSALEQEINNTKKRIQGEFDNGPGFAWITQGREIENYIAIEVLEGAAKTVHASIESLAKKGDYDNRLKLAIVGGTEKEFDMDKVKIAKEVVKKAAGFDILDLQEQVDKVVKFIKDSNGMAVG
ncbi:MAG: AAA family ATPase [Sedimentisphaerales bacterium]|jgi:predicted ATP-dependent endonuclease of OLD family